MLTRGPASNGDCQPGAAGTQKDYSYDSADRLKGTGIRYDPFGRMTQIPSQHSGGGALTYSYHVNDQVKTIAQDGVCKDVQPGTRRVVSARAFPAAVRTTPRRCTTRTAPTRRPGRGSRTGRARRFLGSATSRESTATSPPSAPNPPKAPPPLSSSYRTSTATPSRPRRPTPTQPGQPPVSRPTSSAILANRPADATGGWAENSAAQSSRPGSSKWAYGATSQH